LISNLLSSLDWYAAEGIGEPGEKEKDHRKAVTGRIMGKAKASGKA
jgi:hypothetical protein